MHPSSKKMMDAAGLVDKELGEILEIMALYCDSGNQFPALRGLGYEEALALAEYILEGGE